MPPKKEKKESKAHEKKEKKGSGSKEKKPRAKRTTKASVANMNGTKIVIQDPSNWEIIYIS